MKGIKKLKRYYVRKTLEPGDRYRIDYINDNFGVRTGDITNLEDGTRHFAHSEHWKRIITVEENRELQLNQLGL